MGQNFFQITINGMNLTDYEIRDLKRIIDISENLLFVDKKERENVTFAIQEGSIKNVFYSSLLVITTINNTINEIYTKNEIDFLNKKQAESIESLQDLTKEKSVTITLETSIPKSKKFIINQTTNYYRKESIFIDSELYLYGEIIDAGGKDKPNIHLDVKDIGVVKITIDKKTLKSQKENMLYKKYGVLVKAKKNLYTGELELSSLEMLDFFEFNDLYNEEEMNKLSKQAKWLSKIDDEDLLLKELRNG